MSSVSAIALPAGVMRQPLGKSNPPGMGCGSCLVGSPIVRGVICGGVVCAADAPLLDCPSTTAERRTRKPKSRRELEVDVIKVSGEKYRDNIKPMEKAAE